MSMSKAQLKKLRVTYFRMLHSIMKIRINDKVKLSEISEITGTKEIGGGVKRKKLAFAGHMVRGEDKWEKIAEEWSPREWKRKRGRPPTRWRDESVKAFE